MEPEHLQTLIATMGAVDHRRVAWPNVRWSAYLIHQHFRYEYPGEIANLQQRLMLVPPERHGDQRLVTHKLETSVAADVREERDAFGNLVLHLYLERVERAVDFTTWIVVEREAENGAATGTYAVHDPALRAHSRLTAPDPALVAVARSLAAEGDAPLDVARRINLWVYGEMTYIHGVTGVRTTATEAFALRRGVCQDYAHIMLALCREAGLAARYVSGHLLGEGGTHAWVEVLIPNGHGNCAVHPFDPTHGVEPGLNYITVAVGRDYGDVAPTSGTYRAPFAGRLSGTKRAGVTGLEYF